MQLLFGNAPTNASFDAKLLTFEEPLRREYRLKLCQLAFGYYDKLPVPFRKFTDKYMKHDRSLYVDYLIHHTPAGKLRHPLHNQELFLPLLYVLENAEHRGRVKYHQLAASLLLAFEFPYKLDTLDYYLCQARPDAGDLREFLFLMGKIVIESD